MDARHKAGHDGIEVRPGHDSGDAMRFNSSWPGIKPSFVMAGLVPALHVFGVARPQDVDARDKRGHDGREAVRFHLSSWPDLFRPSTSLVLKVVKTWMPGIKPGMTGERQCVSIRHGRGIPLVVHGRACSAAIYGKWGLPAYVRPSTSCCYLYDEWRLCLHND